MTDLAPAPFHADVTPENGADAAWWLTTSDGVRIRIAIWTRKDARGTVLLFPGRTEYVEKYADAAREFGERGYATLAIDWRGQGLADRLISDRILGHVNDFSDYGRDVDAVVKAAQTLDLPRPWHLLGHSMGGGIGLDALLQGLPVQSAAFTGPMWGIHISPVLRAAANALVAIAPRIGLGHVLPPTTFRENYVTNQPFDGNALTRDKDMYDMMRRQISTHPELAIGGPTLIWLREALSATARMADQASPDCPCLCVLGEAEQIVDTNRVRARMDAWPNGRLLTIPDAEHEVMMEIPKTRETVFDALTELFDAQAA